MLHQLRSELDINSLINAIDGAMFSNGVGSSVPRSSLYPGQAAASVTGTIGSAFAANPLGLTAMSQLGTNATAVGINIYINPGLITSGLSNNAALLLHEGLHVLGFDDADLQTALGYPVDPNNAKEITTRLQKDCVNGKGNY